MRTKPSAQKDCIEELVELLQTRFRGQSGIIYTTSVKDCDQLAQELRQHKCRVASYHASLEPTVRTKVHSGWRDNTFQVCKLVLVGIAFNLSFKIYTGGCCHYCLWNGNR